MFRWLAENTEFRDQYARAREAQAEFLAELALEQAVKAAPKNVHSARLAFDARRWFLGKMAPRKYGDRIAVDASFPSLDELLAGHRPP